MTMPPTFLQVSCDIAARFLHSVVVVDDRAEYATDEVAGRLKEVPTFSEDTERPNELRSRRKRSGLVTPEDRQRPAENLNAKSLVDGFAEKGLVCAILRPAKAEEQATSRTVFAARCSDIVVLDWNFYGDDGATTCDLITKILADDAGRDRLRLIAVYTGERHLGKIATRLRTKFNEILPSSRLRRDGEFVMTKDGVRIAVFAKTDTPFIARDIKGRQRIVGEADLPSRLVTEFAALTSGLVSNVALDSLAALRENTHRILKSLRPSLDAAYLWHRAVLVRPADAEEHLVALVASEIRSVLDDEMVGSRADMESIDLWLAEKGTTDYGPSFGESVSRTVADVHELLEVGAAGKSEQSKEVIGRFGRMKREKAHRKTADLPVFASSGAEATRSNEEFARLMSLKTHYTHPVPILSLGAILTKGRSPRRTYWLCVQPRCDSVRLTAPRAFPLLPLAIATDDIYKFGIILSRKKGASIRLRVSDRPHDLCLVEFAPTAPADSVIAAWARGTFRFVSSDNTIYTWLADLKEDQAQRVATDLAYQFGRIGLTESEWLLLSATK